MCGAQGSLQHRRMGSLPPATGTTGTGCCQQPCLRPDAPPSSLTKVNVGGLDASSVLHLTASLVKSSQAFVLRIAEGSRIGEAGQRSKVSDLVVPIAAGVDAAGHRVEVEGHLHWCTGS